MEKNGLRYSFEKISGKDLGKNQYQVRISGQFIMFAETNSPEAADEQLVREGFHSRREAFEASLEDCGISLRLAKEILK